MIAASKSFTSYKMCDFCLLCPVFRTILVPTKIIKQIHWIFTSIDARLIKHKYKTLPTRLQILPIQTVGVTKSHNVRKRHTVIIIANDTTSKHNTFSFTSILAIQIFILVNTFCCVESRRMSAEYRIVAKHHFKSSISPTLNT